ncbi:hypothetical protein [Micromonospora sp. NPDC049301]|uniref:hypothetical protein n=1 Tax=Micromonospora sp. NPDC049301 TaxID=3155723 RepID=UPI003448446F
MRVLDLLAGWIQRLPVLPAQVRSVLWLPILALVVIIGLRLLVRRALPWLGRLATAGLGWLAVMLGAVLLLPDVLVSLVYRRTGNRPPALIYGYGDAVVEVALGLRRWAALATPASLRLARVNFGVVLLVALGWLWLWNQGYCPENSTGGYCVRPVEMWVAAVEAS